MMKSVITALVALVIGAAGMYFYQQGAVSELRKATAALQTQAAESKAAADAANPKVQEWEELMWKYQQAIPGTKAGEKWVLMDQIFEL